MQERAVGRGCDRAFVGACRLVQSVGCSRGARGVDQILKTAETQYIHSPPHICQLCVGSQGRFERFERRRVALERKEHLTAPDERRHIGWRRPQDAVERTERKLDGARARALLETLPALQREVLELGYFGGLSFSEIAAALDIPIGTVKSRVSAAMNKLREDLGVRKEAS